MGGAGSAEGGGDAPSKAVEPAAAARPAATAGADVPAASGSVPAEETVITGGFTGPPPKPPRRERVPLWAMPVLAILPLWAIGYAGAFGERGTEVSVDPIVVGQSVYLGVGTCAGCHGPAGAGQGAFPAMTDVKATFPNFDDHLAWIRSGSAPVKGQPYGALGRVATGAMPAFPNLTDEQVIAVTCYERIRFGGQDIAELPQCTEDAAIARAGGAAGSGAAASAESH